jgi:glycosyltransferase involved in cell wall biosynthesis
MRIVFLGDVSHPNAQSWIQGLKDSIPCDVVTWSLPNAPGAGGRIVRALSWVQAAVAIRRMVSRLAPDLLIAYRTTSYGCLAAMSGFHPLVVAAQGETDVWPLDSRAVWVKRAMARFCLRNADLIHAWGDHMAQEQLSLGAVPEKVLVRPRGIDLDLFFPAPSRVPVDALRLICTRSLYPEYRHEIILEAMASLAARGVPVSLDLVGDGPLMSELQRQVAALGLTSQVRFHGRVRHDRLAELLRQSHVYVSMPVTEGVSASLLEAMACGCYPIVTNLIANRYWITQHENGTLVPIDDVAALDTALLAVWRNMDMIGQAAARNRALVRDKGSSKDNLAVFVRCYQRLIEDAAVRRA